MRCWSRIAVGTVFLLGGFAPSAGYAIGNVLVPSDDDSSSSNLGIAPAPSVLAPAPAVIVPSISTPLPNIPTPAPTASIPGKPTMAPGGDATPNFTAAPISKFTAPITIKAPDPGSISGIQFTPGVEMGANSVEISLTGSSTWSAGDEDAVAAKLGISDSQVSSQCHLALNGMILTNAGPHLFDTGVTAHTTVHYDGTISNVTVAGRALCTLNSTPVDHGFVAKSGDYYIVPLQSVDCPAPPESMKQITVFYSGTTAARCQF